MHFTVHLRGEGVTQNDFSYGLVFIPCPVWIKGAKQLLNLNPERPDFRLGSVARLIEQEGIGSKLSGSKQAAVLVYPGGHGSIADMTTLQRDLLEQGFSVRVYGEIDNTGPYSPSV